MTQPDPPRWLKEFTEACERAGDELGKAVHQAGHILSAQGALGWMMRGDLENARLVIRELPPDTLRELSAAATALAALADESLRESR